MPEPLVSQLFTMADMQVDFRGPENISGAETSRVGPLVQETVSPLLTSKGIGQLLAEDRTKRNTATIRPLFSQLL